MVKWLLLWSLGGAGVVIVAACIAVLFARHRFQRHHRVDPKIPTDAPAAWAVDPRPAARLHRRLARVGTLATRIGDDHRPRARLLGRRPDPSPLAEAADDVRAQAVTLDRRLARVAVLAPSARKVALVEAAAATRGLETAAARLAQLSAEAQTPRRLAHDDPDVTAVQTRIGHIADALSELDDLDRQAGLAPGLASPPPALTPMATSPTTVLPAPAPPPPPPPAPSLHR